MGCDSYTGAKLRLIYGMRCTLPVASNSLPSTSSTSCHASILSTAQASLDMWHFSGPAWALGGRGWTKVVVMEWPHDSCNMSVTECCMYSQMNSLNTWVPFSAVWRKRNAKLQWHCSRRPSVSKPLLVSPSKVLELGDCLGFMHASRFTSDKQARDVCIQTRPRLRMLHGTFQ